MDPAPSSVATGISPANGFVVGWQKISLDETHAVRWQGGDRLALTALPGETYSANAVNSRGEAVGVRTGQGVVLRRPTFWDAAGVLKRLKTREGINDTTASGINDRGVFVGHDRDATGTSTALMWKKFKLRVLPGAPGSIGASAAAVSNGGWIAGESFNASGQPFATLWKNGEPIAIGTPDEHSRATDVNDNGVAVGSFRASQPVRYRPFIWRNGVRTQLATLDDRNGSATAVNTQGVVVGESETRVGGPFHAMRWQGSEMIDLNTVLSGDVRRAGWVLEAAFDISEAGVIMGRAINRITGESGPYLLTPE